MSVSEPEVIQITFHVDTNFSSTILLFSDQSTSLSITVSWIHRGNALLNNTVLIFNKDDTLNLACTASTATKEIFLFSITKGTSPPSNVNLTATSYGSRLAYTDLQTLIYDDIDGISDGYENILILSKNYLGLSVNLEFKVYMSIGVLRPSDAGIYFCVASVPKYSVSTATGIAAFANSGGVTIQVNTKPGQARSSRANAQSFLAYSTVLLSAYKLLF